MSARKPVTIGANKTRHPQEAPYTLGLMNKVQTMPELGTKLITKDGTADITLTATDLKSGGFVTTSDGAHAINLPAIADILAAYPNLGYTSTDRDAYFFTIVNTGAHNLTVTGGTSVTVVGTATVNAQAAIFVVYKTGSGAVAFARV